MIVGKMTCTQVGHSQEAESFLVLSARLMREAIRPPKPLNKAIVATNPPRAGAGISSDW